jgi:hypothetical protein
MNFVHFLVLAHCDGGGRKDLEVEENVVDARLGETVDRLGGRGGHVMGFEYHSSTAGLSASSTHAAVKATH